MAVSVTPGAMLSLDAGLSLRMRRKKILTSERAPDYTAIIGEAALRQQVGGTLVMRTQLQALLRMGQRENIRLQVLPFTAGAHPAHGGAFTWLRLDSGNLEVILTETLTSAQYVETESELRKYREVWCQLREQALSEAASLAMFERLASAL